MELPKEIRPHLIEPDVLIVNKPSGPTSFDVIRFLRKTLGIRKMGHAGTLDPLASGLMIIGIQTGTKKLTQYLKLPKTYHATIRLGVATTSGDIEGEVMRQQQNIPDFTQETICSAIENLVGQHTVVPPVYSALKVHGRPLYWYARKGLCPIAMPIKEMGVTNAEFHEYSQNEQGDWEIRCILSVTSGTYIRSLAELIGDILGVPATLSGLIRLSIGDYQLDQAMGLSGML